jgi:hypothetical protein
MLGPAKIQRVNEQTDVVRAAKRYATSLTGASARPPPLKLARLAEGACGAKVRRRSLARILVSDMNSATAFPDRGPEEKSICNGWARSIAEALPPNMTIELVLR